MDRRFLYGIIFILSMVIGVVYLNKTRGGINKIFAPVSKSNDSWMKEDPGWDKMNFEYEVPKTINPPKNPNNMPDFSPRQPTCPPNG